MKQRLGWRGITTIILGALVPGISAGWASESAPRLAARERLHHYLFWNPGGAASAQSPQRVREMLEDYRWSKGQKAVLPLNQGPFPRVLLGLLLKDAEVYGQLYTSQYEALTTAPTYEELYDAFLGLKLAGTLPASIRQEAKSLTIAMARKASRAKSEFCRLDESDRLNPPSKLKLLKIWMGLAGGCETRKAIFGAVKKNLRDVRRNLADLKVHRQTQGTDPCAGTDAQLAAKFSIACGVIAEVNKDYGRLFRDGLGTMLDELAMNFPKLFVKKFGGSDHPIWSEIGSVIDPVEDLAIAGGFQTLQLRSFARGMRVDLQAAKVLMHSKLESDRALAAGLFYAVVNRMIFLLGGEAVKLREGHLALVDTATYRKNGEGEEVAEAEPAPLDERGLLKSVYEKSVAADGTLLSEKLHVKPLVFELEPIGGWGVGRVGNVLTPSPWDPIGYDPDATDPALRTPFRLIPTRLKIDSQGKTWLIDPLRDLVQKNTDLAELGLALAEFIQETKPQGAFGKFFGPRENALDLKDPKKPMLIPDVGRLLPVAILGVIAQNALHPELGHVRELADGAKLAFQDEAGFDHVSTTDIGAEGIAGLLNAVHDLREALRDDPIFGMMPSLAALQADVKNLEGVLQLGVLIFGAQTQEPGTGKLHDQLYATGERTHSLDTQLNGLLGFIRAYNRAHTVPMTRVRLRDGIQYLASELSQTDPKSLSRDQLFRLSQLWQSIQVHLPADWPELPWKEWDALFHEFRREFERDL